MNRTPLLILGGVVISACGGDGGPSPPAPVASVEVAGPDSLLFNQVAQFTVTLRDANGGVLSGRGLTWGSSDSAVATVTSLGEVTVLDTGAVVISATSEGVTGQRAVAAWSLLFDSASVSAGESETCALSGGKAYCWGWLAGGAVPTALADPRTWASVHTGSGRACALMPAGEPFCWTDLALGAAAVAGSPALTGLSLGFNHTCGFAIGGSAFCWGNNSVGKLGTGLTSDSPLPTAVAGGRQYLQVSAAANHSCAVTTTGAGFCWGHNGYGQLGSAVVGSSNIPVPVNGGLTFSAIEGAALHSCGIAADSAAWCWGDNEAGMLGDNSTTFSPVPVPVSGGFKAIAIAVGIGYTCALSPAGAAFCWGINNWGQLGTGTAVFADSVPVAVTGGLTFVTISAGGGSHTCGQTADGIVYCWGYNGDGELGVSGSRFRSAPVKVMGQF